MSKIKIHVFHTGSVCVSPAVPFGGEHCSTLKASGLFLPQSKRIWVPVSCYVIEHPKGRIMVDPGWSRAMSPKGELDKAAQIKELGSRLLYRVNQGVVPKGEAPSEHLAELGLTPADLDYVILSHLDCDHAVGLREIAAGHPKRILTSKRELENATSRPRFNPMWWEGTGLETFDWNDDQGSAHHSYDLFGDSSVELINIPGHTLGLCAVKIKNADGRFVLLFVDGGYAAKSWQEMIVPGVGVDRAAQKKSLEWIREQSLDPNCLESLATHDPDIKPHVIEL